MTNTTIELTPTQLADKLFDYPQCGTHIYNRPKAQRPSKKTDCHITVLQLIISGMISLNIKYDKKPTAYCVLSFHNTLPKYYYDEYWAKFNHINSIT